MFVGLSVMPACDELRAKAAVCADACDDLIACDVPYDRGTCRTGCERSLRFADCASEALGDCNALALCAFRQHSADACGGSSGVPRGNDSCEEVAACQGGCSLAAVGEACACGCQAELAPAAALQLLINDQCAVARCPEVCLLPHLPSPACLACFELRCHDESAQCSDDVPEPSDPQSADSGRVGVGPADGGSSRM